MTTKDLIQSYYDSLSQKDTKWKELWKEDAYFSDASQMLTAKGKEAVIQSFIPFLKGVQEVKIKQTIIEENNACVIVSYDYMNPKGEKLHQDVAEVWEVKDAQLARLTIYFDLTEYRTFMRG
ncbi:MAG TPA: nuclear transport factor 2 family protein [Candidatus Saccharimonadales bacterium]|nr:nuclear transport factor 2 family protein [Candidatus Saccharimonadales bacterium]